MAHRAAPWPAGWRRAVGRGAHRDLGHSDRHPNAPEGPSYGVRRTGNASVWKRIIFSVLVVPAFALAGIVAIGLLVVTSRTLMRGAGLMALDAAIVAVWDWFRVPAALMLLMGLLSAVYKVAAGDHPPLRRSLPGAALGAALWALVSVAFPFALSTVLHFEVTYGSFSAAIVVLVYLYLLAAAVLLGAEVNATLDSRPTNAVRGRA